MAGRPNVRSPEDFNALMQSQLFARLGMMPTPEQASLQTAMLPQIMQMKQMELTQKLAKESREAYLKRFQEYYGFRQDQLDSFQDDFANVKEQILKMIPDTPESKAVKDMYESFLAYYPDMYLTMIPKEILAAKLNEKCVSQNKILRSAIPKISEAIVGIMRELAALQETLGVSPYVATILGDMPDPIALQTDPRYAPYNSAMKIFGYCKDKEVIGNSESALDDMTDYANGNMGVGNAPAPGTAGAPAKEEILAAISLLKNTAMGSACAPFGPEFSQKGPKPNKNAGVCLAQGQDAAWSTGNPNDPKGSKQIYRAQRMPDGSVDWVLTGDMAPVVNGFGMPEMGAAYANQMYRPQPVKRKSKKGKTSKGSKSKSKSSKSKK